MIIGFLLGLLVRRAPASSTNPAVDPPPSGPLNDVIESEVKKGVEVNDLNKRTDKALEELNKYAEKKKP